MRFTIAFVHRCITNTQSKTARVRTRPEGTADTFILSVCGRARVLPTSVYMCGHWSFKVLAHLLQITFMSHHYSNFSFQLRFIFLVVFFVPFPLLVSTHMKINYRTVGGYLSCVTVTENTNLHLSYITAVQFKGCGWRYLSINPMKTKTNNQQYVSLSLCVRQPQTHSFLRRMCVFKSLKHTHIYIYTV